MNNSSSSLTLPQKADLALEVLRKKFYTETFEHYLPYRLISDHILSDIEVRLKYFCMQVCILLDTHATKNRIFGTADPDWLVEYFDSDDLKKEEMEMAKIEEYENTFHALNTVFQIDIETINDPTKFLLWVNSQVALMGINENARNINNNKATKYLCMFYNIDIYSVKIEPSLDIETEWFLNLLCDLFKLYRSDEVWH